MFFILAAFTDKAVETLHPWVNSLDFVLWSLNSAVDISATSLIDLLQIFHSLLLEYLVPAHTEITFLRSSAKNF